MARIALLMLASAIAISACAPVNQSTKPAAYHYQMGVSFIEERNYSAALTELTEAEKQDPNNPDMLYYFGLAYMGKRRYDLAEPKFLKAIQIKPSFTRARNDLGVVYMELQKWDNAIQQLKIAKEDLLYEQSENATLNLSMAYLGKRDYGNAWQETSALLTHNPGNPIIYLTMGRILFAQEKTAQSINAYRKAIELYPEYAAAYYYLGVSLMKQNDLPGAKAAFLEAARIAPNFEVGRLATHYLDLLK
jgi:type IV pilus assembly protein PilF